MLYHDIRAENVLTYKIKCLLMNILLLYAPPHPSLPTKSQSERNTTIFHNFLCSDVSKGYSYMPRSEYLYLAQTCCFGSVWSFSPHPKECAEILYFFDHTSQHNSVKKNQLHAQLILSIFRQPLHVSGVSWHIIRRYNCMYTTHHTHDLHSGSQDHHPSTNLVQKTIWCNSTSNATRTAPSAPYTRPTQWLPRPIHKLGTENHMLQLNI